MASKTTGKASAMAGKLDLVGAIVALVLGLLLIIGVLDLEIILGIALIVIGVLALMKNM